MAGPANAGDAEIATLAGEIREASGFAGGLIVHLDCDDGMLTLAVAGDGVLFAEQENIACLDLGTGMEKWTVPCVAVRTLVVYENTVFAATADPKRITLTAFDLDSGQRLWSREADALPNFVFFFAPLDVFVARGLVWGMAEGLEWNTKPGSGHLLGLEPRTGEVRRRIPLAGAFTTDHHVRCYKGKATENYLLLNKRGIEFIGLEPDRAAVSNRYQWVRGTCRYGILPSNGLIYAPPHACACYPGAKVDGFLALASEDPAGAAVRPSGEGGRLERGPAYTAQRSGAGNADASSWPTYRGDLRRSGRARTAVPSDLAVAWEAKPGVRLSSPVVAGGRVLAADRRTSRREVAGDRRRDREADRRAFARVSTGLGRHGRGGRAVVSDDGG